MEKPMVLGNTLHQLKKYIIENYGQQYFDNLIKDFDPELKDILKNIISSGKFYDVRAKVELVTAFRNDKPEEEATKMTIVECDSQINWLYGLILRAISLKQAASLSGPLWKKSFNTGEQKSELSEDGKKIHVIIKTGHKITPAYVKHIETYEKRFLEIVGKCQFKSSSKMINDTDMELDFEIA